MSCKDNIMISLQEETSHAETLNEILKLDIKYKDATGTSMIVQDYFRDLKCEFVMEGLREINLDSFVTRFYNYSMRGYCQIFLTPGCDVRLNNYLDELTDYYDLPYDHVTVDVRRDSVVLCLGELK